MRRSHKVTDNDLACAWLLLPEERKTVPSQEIAARLIGEGAVGILMRSFAPGSKADNHNLVLWKWSSRLPHTVRIHDPGKRLPKDCRSWG